MDNQQKSRGSAPANPYTGNSVKQRETAPLNPMELVSASDRTIAARSINRPRHGVMPTAAAQDIIASFVASLQHVPAQNAYVTIGYEFVSRWSKYYNDSKTIIRQSANHSLINNSYSFAFNFQVPRRMLNDPDLKGILQDARDDAFTATKKNHEHYLKAVTAVNKDLKLDLMEFIARSLPQLSKIVLITHNAIEYGRHNLVADMLVLAYDEILMHFTTLEKFVKIYKSENKCGRVPEDAKVLLERLTPPVMAVREEDVTTTRTEAEVPLVLDGLIPETPKASTAPNGNLKCPIGIYRQEEPSDITESSKPAGFVSALDLYNKAQTEGFDLLKFLKEASEQESIIPPQPQVQPPNTINTPAQSSATAATTAAPEALSPLRTLKQPQTNKFWFSRNYSRSELKTIIGFKEESTRLIRCKRLTLINSIRDENYVEGSLLSSISAETADTPAKRLFASLEEVDFEAFDHKTAIQDLLEAVQWLFLQPRAIYITQYMYILTAKDLKKSQVQNDLPSLASDSAERMNSEQNAANPPTSEKTIGTTVDKSVDKRMNKHKKETNEATASILERMELIEQQFKLERSKRLESERELQDLKTSLESKEEVPSSDSGTETIDSDRSKPHHHPKSKVKFQSLPPSNNNPRNTPKQRRKHHQELEQNIHGRAAKKRRKKQDEVTDAEQDTLNVSETTSLRPPFNSSRHKKKSRNKQWKRPKDTRKH